MFDNCLTNIVKSKVAKQDLTIVTMKEEIINVREFIRNYKNIIGKNKIFIISKHGKPESVFVPYDKWVESNSLKFTKLDSRKRSKVNLWEAIEKYTSRGTDPNISQKVDEIVYGAPNPYRDDHS